MTASEIHLILGAGQAGAWAAMAMREAGFQGRILLIGDEPYRPYERPPLSKDVLTASAEPSVTHVHAESRYAERGIELLLGARAEGIDIAARRLHLADGTRLPFDQLLLATGGRARQLHIPGAGHAHSLRSLDDARRLRALCRTARRVLCIGAGIIGLEVASSAQGWGSEVTVLEAGPTAMGRCVPPEIAGFVEQLHRRAGNGLHFGLQVTAIAEQRPGVFRVETRESTVFEAECVLAGIGMERNTELAAEAGIAVENGILVDEYGRTDQPGIFAAGDVAAFWHPLFRRRLRLEAWRHAQNHGAAVGRSMGGKPEAYADLPWFWTDQLGVNLQVGGLPDRTCRTVLRGGMAQGRFLALHLDAEDRVVAATAANRPRDMRPALSLIQAGLPVDLARAGDEAVPLAALLPPRRPPLARTA